VTASLQPNSIVLKYCSWLLLIPVDWSMVAEVGTVTLWRAGSRPRKSSSATRLHSVFSFGGHKEYSSFLLYNGTPRGSHR